MAYYSVCDSCGCNLDPGERCDCESIKAREQEESITYYRRLLRADKDGCQMAFDFENLEGGVVGA